MNRLSRLMFTLLLACLVPVGVHAAPDHDWGEGRHHDRDWDDHHDRRGHRDWDRSNSFTVVCESRDYRRAHCPVRIGSRGNVRVLRQYSDSPCRLNRTWGWSRNAIWVNQGCAAEFEVNRH